MMDKPTICIAQVSDTHLFNSASQSLLNINTEESLQAVLSELKAHALPDLVLLTGDLSQDGSAASYQRLEQHIKTVDRPAYWLSGNHDEFHIAYSVFEDSAISNDKAILIQDWQIILLNSQKPGAVEGYLSEKELVFLESQLQQYPDRYALICLHHQPLPIGSQWLDRLGVQNAEAFLSIVDNYSQVRGVIWGHIHQKFETLRNGIPFLSVPSTCIQFLPNSTPFALDPNLPGYRWLELNPDGTIQSQVYRAVNFKGQVDLSSSGY